jgi:hypothetical protein
MNKKRFDRKEWQKDYQKKYYHEHKDKINERRKLNRRYKENKEFLESFPVDEHLKYALAKYVSAADVPENNEFFAKTIEWLNVLITIKSAQVGSPLPLLENPYI